MGGKRVIHLLTGFILGHCKGEQLETTMSTLEERNKGESNLYSYDSSADTFDYNYATVVWDDTVSHFRIRVSSLFRVFRRLGSINATQESE